MEERTGKNGEVRAADAQSPPPAPDGIPAQKVASQPFVGSLIEHLVYKGIITREVAEKVVATRHSTTTRNKKSIVTVISEGFGIPKEVLYDEVAEFYSFRIINITEPSPRRISASAAKKLLSELPEAMYQLALKFKVLPYEYADDQCDKLILVTPYPSEREIHDIARAFRSPQYEICYVRERDYAELWRAATLDKTGGTITPDVGVFEESDAELEGILEKEINRGELVALIENLFADAVRVGASDIHFRPRGIRKTSVNFRIDGSLTEWHLIDGIRSEAVTAVVKSVGQGLDRFDRLSAQDGSAQRMVDGELIRYRVSVLPMVLKELGGKFESVAVRILRVAGETLTVDNVGFDEYSYKWFMHAIAQPNGMITLTGPTGSGKSTTLVAALRSVMCPELNTISVEDPVEYILEGALQVKLGPKLSFEDALRAILRHDPDIVMVGEIRDRITADIAIKLANTGHLTFSTVHTNDAPSVVSRLFKIGVEPFLIAQAMNIVVAQRLVRKLCDRCKVRDEKPATPALERAGFSREEIDSLKLYKPVGCSNCNGGYRGRTAIHESLFFTREIRNIILDSGEEIDVNAIRESALHHGMQTLRRSGLALVKKGISSVEEIVANTTLETTCSKRHVPTGSLVTEDEERVRELTRSETSHPVPTVTDQPAEEFGPEGLPQATAEQSQSVEAVSEEAQRLQDQERARQQEEEERRRQEKAREAEIQLKLRASVQRSQQYLAQEQFDQALEEVSQALELDANSSEALSLQQQIRSASDEARKRREQEHARQLEEQERRRQEEALKAEIQMKLTASLERSQLYLAQEQFDQALEEVSQALALEPNNSGALSLQQQIQTASYEARKREEEEERRRQEEARKAEIQLKLAAFIQRSQQYLTQEEFDRALQEVSQALELDPNSPEALSLQQQIRTASDEARKRQEEEARKAEIRLKVAAFIQRSQQYLSHEQFDRALEEVTQALTLDPDSSEAVSLQQQIRTASDEARKRQEEERRKREEEEARRNAQKQKIDQYLTRSHSLLAEGRLQEAENELAFVVVIDPLNPEVLRLQQQIREAQEGRRRAEVEQRRRKEEEERKKLEATRDAIRTHIDNATKLAAEGNFNEALRVISLAYFISPLDEAVQSCENKILADQEVALRRAQEERNAQLNRYRLQAERERQNADLRQGIRGTSAGSETQEKCQQHLGKAREHLTQQEFERALAEVALAFMIDPFSNQVKQIEQEIRDAQALQHQQGKGAVPPAAARSDHSRQVEKHVAAAQRHRERREYAQALDELAKAFILDPLNPAIQECEDSIRKVFPKSAEQTGR